MFKKENIKPGMVIETMVKETGEKRLAYITESRNGLVGIYKDGKYILLDSYDDSLSTCKSCIVAVYDFCDYNYKALNISTEDRELLWKREYLTDWSKVEVDTKVLVRNTDDADWERRYFAEYRDGKVYVFPAGCDSWSSHCNYHDLVVWRQVRLYK